MLNRTEQNNVVICVVPLNVEPIREMRQTSIRCNNGIIHIKGERYNCEKVMEWLEMFGVKTFSQRHKDYDITLDESGVFHIFGDDNDGSYRYFRGSFMNKVPYKCFNIVEVEPLEDGGRVWRNFDDFDVDVKFTMYEEEDTMTEYKRLCEVARKEYIQGDMTEAQLIQYLEMLADDILRDNAK